MLHQIDPQESAKCTPDYWFLTDEESRYLSVRSKSWYFDYKIDRLAYTSGNRVTPLIDGAAYMANLYHNLTALKTDDYLYMVGWQFTPEQFLLDKDEKIPNTVDTDETAPLLVPAPSLTTLLEQCIQRGTDVRVMAYWPTTIIASAASKALGNYQPLPQGQNDIFVKRIQAAGGRAVLDVKLPDATLIPKSHHQKALVLRRAGQTAHTSAGSIWALIAGIHQNTCARLKKPPSSAGMTSSAWLRVRLFGRFGQISPTGGTIKPVHRTK